MTTPSDLGQVKGTFLGAGAVGVWAESWVAAAEASIEALGYELVDVERAGRGLLRVTLDSPNGIGVEDCEKVSRQLSHLLMVENVNYDRLEVSSPGVDRALKREKDFEKFLGVEVAIKLRVALANRKNYVGVLGRKDTGEYFLVCEHDKKGEPPFELVFNLSELDTARLVPHLKF